MASVADRGGFTLVEAMISLGLLLVVLGGLGTFVLGAHSLSKGAYAEAELSLHLRLLRERLLFQVAPPHDGKRWSGLLSGESIPGAADAAAVRLTSRGVVLADGTSCAQTIALEPQTESAEDGESSRWLANTGDPVDAQWRRPYLRPLPAYLPEDWLDDSSLADHHLFFITLDATLNGYSRSERLAVPMFGKEQTGGSGGVFHDQ